MESTALWHDFELYFVSETVEIRWWKIKFVVLKLHASRPVKLGIFSCELRRFNEPWWLLQNIDL